MSAFFNLFKPAPHLPEIQDKEKVDSLFKYWRVRTLYSMFIGFALYYFTRRSLSFAMPGLIEDLGFLKTDLGILTTILSVSYGCSKFVSGIISDRSNPRYLMAAGLMITGVLNILFGLSSSIALFAVFWGLNGWFQGLGVPPCARLLTHWYSQSERGSWWSSWSISHNVGSFLISWIAGFCIYYLGWRWAMYIPGLLCIGGSFFLINRLRDTPQSLGLPPVEKYRNDYPSKISLEDQEKELSTRELLFEHVLKNKYIWLLGIAYFFVYIVRTGISDWTALFLIEAKEYSRLGASGAVSIVEVGGFLGMLTAGWSSDYFFKAKRGPVNALFAFFIFFFLFVFWMVPAGYPLLDTAVLFMLGFSIFGPQMLIGMAAAELTHKKAAATSNGFVGWMAYIGAAVAGWPLSKITQELGWNGFFYFLVVCSALGICVLLPLWNVKEARKPKEAAVPVLDESEKEPEFA